MEFRPRGFDVVKNYLKTVPYGALKVGLKFFVDYIVGNQSHGLRHDEPQKYVSRKSAGYKTSAAQMRFFFATGILERTSGGGIKLNRYVRTTETAAAWKSTPTNNGYGYTISNEKDGAYWTRSDEGQSRQHELAGRRKITKVIMDNLKGAIRHANAEIKKYLGSKK